MPRKSVAEVARLKSITEVPVHTRDGVWGYAIVDAIDAERVLMLRWSKHVKGYAASATCHPPVLMHRFILGLTPGDGLEVDHINRNKLDNRRSNLRAVEGVANRQNLAKRAGTSSRFRGVNWHPATGKWMARATVNYTPYYLGVFDSEEEAAAVATAFRLEHMQGAVD